MNDDDYTIVGMRAYALLVEDYKSFKDFSNL